MSDEHRGGELRLFDTLRGECVVFRPERAEVTLYVCGVTPYDTAHLGHGFTYVSFDVLVRYLQYRGYRVRYVQNVTDIDDPLFEKAKQLGISHWELARDETERYLADMAALNVLRAEVYPRASMEIPRMIELIGTLIEGRHAYAIDGFVYFSVASDPEYGKLSKLDRDGMIARAREMGGDPGDPRKHDPLDFILWRPARDGEPEYESPWGAGLPGWHIECSAMALTYLGAPLDIHGGGNDLIFPHHESEIAQSEAVDVAHPFARVWMHTGMVNLGGVKMSKSLGNMVFIRDLVRDYGSDAVRLYLSGCQYRSDLHYAEEPMAEAARLAGRLAMAAGVSGGERESQLVLDPYRARFEDRMNDDLDTPGAIAVLSDLADALDAGAKAGENIRAGQALLRELGGVLGLKLERYRTTTERSTSPRSIR
jgi:L-cysteine:1D-myo-inositol 2-amino-2-deoxy-alpha-D-glucopyranoside ligase